MKLCEKYNETLPELWSDNTDPDKYRRNLLRLEVFYEEMNYEKITEMPAYTVSFKSVDHAGYAICLVKRCP